MNNLGKKVSFRGRIRILAVVCGAFFISGVAGYCQEGKEEVDRLYAKFRDLEKDLRYEEAAQTGVLLVKKGEEVFGRDHPNTAIFLNNLAHLYQAQGKYEKAEPLYKRALAVKEEQLGSDHPSTATSLNNLADLYELLGKYEKAEPLYKRSLKIREERLGKDHPSTANSLNNLAVLYNSQGKYEEAELLHERALKIREEKLGADHLDTANSMNNLAVLYKSQGKYEEAGPLYERALKIREEQLGADHPKTATTLNNLAGLYESQGKYEQAEPLYKRVLKIREEQLGEDHPSTATSLNNLAVLYESQGRYEEAESLFVRALNIDETQLGENHPDTAISLNNLATVYKLQAKFAEAEPMYKRAMKIWERQLGADHPKTATTLDSLAGLYESQRKYEQAETLYERSLKIRGEQLGADHLLTANSLNNLAGLYNSIGKLKDAESLYKRALEICDKKLGGDHPDTVTLLNNLAEIFRVQGKLSEANPLHERAIIGTYRHYTRMLRYFPDRDCLAMQSRMHTQVVAGNSQNGEIAAKIQIWLKGAVLEAMNSRRVVEERLQESMSGKSLLSERDELSRRYRREVLEKGTGSKESREIEQQLSDVEKKMALLLKEDLVSAVGMVDLASVQSVIPENSVLVESFRYTHRGEANARQDRYSSALIHREGEPEYLAHGKAEEIEKAIAAYREALTSPKSTDRETHFKEVEATLWQACLAPLENHLSPGQTVIFSLDSQLHFIPLGMIRDAEGVPFGQKYKVRYVTSGRDLVKEVNRNSDGRKSALVLGNPSYRDNQPLRALAEAEEEVEAKLVASNLRAGIQDDAGSITLTPLPGTAREIASLSDKLENDGYTVTSLSQGEATEKALEQAINGHDIVHLATHGFFLSEIERETNPQDGLLSPGGLDQQTTPVIISDPMYRSGLALAGAQSTFNLWKEGKVPPPSKDGILLAAEANLLNLRGTDLVVLSACETASGEALDGEGVMGLRRAFASAGANNTIMTLWPVNDEATVEVMDAFYEKYLSGTHPAIALAEVQNELYQPFVEKYGEVEAIARLAPFVCMSLGKVE